MLHQFTRKPIRLQMPVYRQNALCSITVCTENRVAAFPEPGFTLAAIDELRGHAFARGIEVLAYCFMPDHLHLLVHNTGRSSIVSFMRDFKQRTGFDYKRATGRTLWQKSYYDHYLRRDEDVLAAARYIFANPVRKGLANHPPDYEFSGSFEWGREALVDW